MCENTENIGHSDDIDENEANDILIPNAIIQINCSWNNETRI